MGNTERNISKTLKKLNEEVLRLERNLGEFVRGQKGIERFSEHQVGILTKKGGE